MSNETQKKIAVTMAWLGAMILLLLWLNRSIDEMVSETKAKPRSSAFSGRALLLESPGPARPNGPDYILWLDAKTGHTVKGKAGTWGVPHSLPLPPIATPCDRLREGMVDLNGWLCECGRGPASCTSTWTGPPPLTPARRGLHMNGYHAVHTIGVMEHVGWYWVAERRQG